MSMLEMLILLALAVFFLSRLRAVLGKQIDDDPRDNNRKWQNRMGSRKQEGRVIQLREGDRASEVAQAVAEKEKEDDAPLLADIDDPEVTKGLMDIKNADSGFSVREFLDGAKMAFDMILNAYQKGDKGQLKSLLSKEIYTEFAAAIDARKEAEVHEDNTLVAIESANIIHAGIKGRNAEITVSYLSEQISVERDQQGNIVTGDPSQTDMVEDEWTFTRDMRSQNPNWTLVST